MVDKKEILNQIVNVLEKPFVTHGFRYVRGGRFVRKLSDGNTEQQYHITFRKKYGCFLMSIELIVQNKVLLKDFDVFFTERRKLIRGELIRIFNIKIITE